MGRNVTLAVFGRDVPGVRLGDHLGHGPGAACRPEPTGRQNVGLGAEGALRP